jgi:CDP-diacylglycerol--glycerol-3-phosphate 3-phosphatidyltransferase
MGIMLQRSLRDPVARIIQPFVGFLVKIGVTANIISTLGGVGSTMSALYFFPRGEFIIGAVAVTFFVLFDLFDGAVARASQSGESAWGALLDSTLDRISDAAIFIGGLLFFLKTSDRLIVIFLIAATASFLVSYIRARAESLSIKCDGGFAERSERLIILLVAYGLHGLGLNYAMAIGVWLVAILSIVTVLQRMMIVYKAVN